MMYRRRIRESLFRARGQALIEYALILTLVVMAMAVALAATGPAISNIFSNTVYNLIGLSGTPIQTIQKEGGGANSFWLTVTAVADNPQGEIPFPTNPPAPPTASATFGPPPTPTDITPSPTPSNTPTLPPSATPTDFAFIAPFYDTVDNPERWRIDSNVWIGSDEWKGEYFPNTTWSGPPDFTMWNGEIDTTYKWIVNFDWGSGGPITLPAWLTDNFSIRYTRQIYAPVATPVRFTTSADGQVRLRIQLNQVGAPVDVPGLGLGSGGSAVYAIPAGLHNLILEYAEDMSNPARVSLAISNAGGVNPEDQAIPSGPAQECSWGRENTGNSNTSAFQWDSDIVNVEFPVGRRCHLELRGSIDLAPLTTPRMTFWDYWDLSNNAGTRAYVQVAEYAPPAPPATLAWTTVNLHSGPTTNYNWTMQTVDLTAFAGKKIAVRFVMENNANATPARRWYIDDLTIDNFNTNQDYFVCTGTKASCGTYWDLNNGNQRAYFNTTGRWDLTTTNVQSTGFGPQTSWEDSPLGAPYSDRQNEPTGYSSTPVRVHSLEFRGWINLTNLPGSGTGGTPDADGDDGKPMLSYYLAYDVSAGDRLVLQYTRDLYNAGNGATWTDLTTLVDATSARQTDLTMSFKEQLLDAVPNWNSQRFRLRFALIVTGNNSDSAQGVFIDEMYLEREAKPAFSPYPFLDGAENGLGLWRTEAQWGITNTSGVFGSAQSFTDSPLGDYPNLDSAIQLRGALDLNNNTPENISLYGGNKGYDGSQGTPANVATASNRPYLTFWHWRRVAANETINVDISNNDGASWTTIWTWDYTTYSRSAQQLAWERVEIDLLRAVEVLTGQTWNTISTNGNLTDDDLLVRFRLNALSGASVSDGIYIDDIGIANYSEITHKLWDVGSSPTTGGCSGTPNPPCGNGNGLFYDDDVDTPNDWWTRWYTGGGWGGAEFSNAQHSGLLGLHDSSANGGTSNVNYLDNTYSVLQMRRIIDLRGASASQRPTLYFWTRYDLGNMDNIQVQVSAENGGSTTQGYERVARWDAWENPDSDDRFQTGTTNSLIGQVPGGPFSDGVRLDTWIRVQIDLSAYAGRRIKVRFLLDALDDGADLRTGWFIDDVRFELRTPRVFTLPFFDNAQNTQNWVVEGIWGLDAEKFRGSGGGPAALGPDPWYAYWFDCELSIPPLPATGCTSVARFTTLLTQFDGPGGGQDGSDLPIGPYLDINFDFGSSGRPPGALSGAGGATWDDYYGARFERDITVAAGQFTFITVSDDGVRLRYLNGNCPAPNSPGVPPAGAWNIINNWNYHGRTVNMNTITLAAGQYCLVLEYFEATGDAVIILTAGNNTFSYSDSPKLIAGSPSTDSVPYGNSALVLDGVLNLTGATTAVLEYWTQFDLNSGTFARVEVSVDGGFSWQQTSLGSAGTCDTAGTYCTPTIGSSGSDVVSPAGTWLLRRHNLASYANQNIGLRFRLSTPGSTDDGWWFTDIQVNQ